jgi:hypothetical protein
MTNNLTITGVDQEKNQPGAISLFSYDENLEVIPPDQPVDTCNGVQKTAEELRMQWKAALILSTGANVADQLP